MSDLCFYTPLEECVAELRRRVADIGGRQALARTHPFEELLASGEHALLSRWVLTPSFECLRFIGRVTGTGLRPLIYGHVADRFVGHNTSKLALLQMSFYHGTGRNGGVKLTPLAVADADGMNGKRFDEILTYWGQPLVEFHAELFDAMVPDADAVTPGSISSYYARHGSNAREYYADACFGPCVRHGILFETFGNDGREGKFAREVALPAFHEAWQTHGLKPLVVALDPPGREMDPYWNWYPACLQPLVEEKLRLCGRLSRRLQYQYKGESTGSTVSDLDFGDLAPL